MAQSKICKAKPISESGVGDFVPDDGRPEPKPRILAPDQSGEYWYWTPDDAAPEP